MPTYAIGDIQGCFSALQKLLVKIRFDAKQDTLWLTGDLVNRGLQSLETLRFVKSLGDRHQIVLGNHDLHLIAVAYGVRQQHKSDTLDAILQSEDRDELIEWLCHRRLLVHDAALGFLMTHAGLAPSWDLTQAQAVAEEIEIALRGKERLVFLENMFGNTPDKWEDKLTGMARLRCAVNYFTRMRLCHPDGRLELTYKGSLEHKPADLIPWFDVKPRANANLNLLFGHWASLEGRADVPHVFPLDTGCVWGGCLTAMRLEDGQKFNVTCS